MSNYTRRLLLDARDTLSQLLEKLSTVREKQYRDSSHNLNEVVAAHLDADGKFVPSISERALGDFQFRRIFLPGREGWSETYKAVSHTGVSIYKPASGENLSNSMAVYFPQKHGEYAKREVAAYRVNEQLGFSLVPPTAMVDGPKGPGSNQQFVPSRPAKATDMYDELQQQQMAVLDYIIGNLDRLVRNYRVAPNGDLVAIDHGSSFPEKPGLGIRSKFVDKFRGVPLGEKVLEHVDAVDVKVFRESLRELELSDRAIDGAMERLNEIRSQRRVIGNNWLAPDYVQDFVDSFRKRLRGPLDTGP
ncbi:hypothetical protein [Nocardia sp. CY41]|uniref:hypothetical protein n=1 Tax=Nocardia sp. CY41 TaxID=2608686 RepID=UPI001359A8C1|nr:hypothetical protein [Nocardia sp. CY41]